MYGGTTIHINLFLFFLFLVQLLTLSNFHPIHRNTSSAKYSFASSNLTNRASDEYFPSQGFTTPQTGRKTKGASMKSTSPTLFGK